MAAGHSSDNSCEEVLPTQTQEAQNNANNNQTISALDPKQDAKPTKTRKNTDKNSFVVPEVLCQCLQRCTIRVTPQLISRVCTNFKSITDRSRQYRYLGSLIQRRVKKFSSKPIQKMSFKYFVPVLKPDEAMPEFLDDDEGREYIEVCLKAFINIHLISEKRVTITRATQRLKSASKKTRSFLAENEARINEEVSPFLNKKKRAESDLQQKALERIRDQVARRSGAEVSRQAAEWMAKEALKERSAGYAINPRTLLPEGLVLPASVTCLPVYPTESQRPEQQIYWDSDRDRDVDIVNNFFSDQLWTPEYMGEMPSNVP